MRWIGCLALGAVLVVAPGCGDGDDEPDLAAFCAQVDHLRSNDPFASFGDTAEPAEMRAAFRALVERADDLAAPAPEDIAGAADRYAAAVHLLNRLLAAAAYDGRRVEVLAYGNAQADYDEAKDQIERFANTRCDDR